MLVIKLAFRNIFRQKRRSILTGLTLTGSYALFSMSIGISDGSYENIINIFTRDHTGHIQIHREGYLERPSLNKTVRERESVERALRSSPDVLAYAPRVEASALAYSNQKTSPVEILGIDPLLEAKTTRIGSKIRAGRSLQSSHEKAVLIGAGLARTLKLAPGGEIILISQGVDGSIANDRYEVAGIVGTEDSRERLSVFLPLLTAQDFLSMDDRIHEIAILTNSASRAERVASRLKEILPASGDQQISPWNEVEADFYRGMQIDQAGNNITLAILTLIVAIGVLNTVLMTILERKREYGVLRAVGTRPLLVFRLIVLEAFFLATISVLLGVPIGIGINSWFAHHGIQLEHPIEMGGIAFDTMLGIVSVRSILLPAWVTIGTAVAVACIPAWIAARVQPVDALRSI